MATRRAEISLPAPTTRAISSFAHRASWLAREEAVTERGYRDVSRRSLV